MAEGRIRVRLSASGSFPNRFVSPDEGQGWPLSPPPNTPPPRHPHQTKRRGKPTGWKPSARPCRDKRRSSLPPFQQSWRWSGHGKAPGREEESGGNVRGHKGTAWFNPEHLYGAGRGDTRTPPGGMSDAAWSRGGSISHLPGGAFPILDVGLGLGVASEDSPGTRFYCRFMIIVFLQSHPGCTWSRGPGVTVWDRRCWWQRSSRQSRDVFLLQLPPAMPYVWRHSCWVSLASQCPKTRSLGVVFP